MQPYPEIPLLSIYTTDKNSITTALHAIEKKMTYFHKQGILQCKATRCGVSYNEMPHSHEKQ